MDYLLLKTVHLSAVTLSIAGFTARGAGSLAGAAWVRGRAARTWPHVVDSVLLASALALATFGYIVSVAFSKTPLGFLSWL